MRVVINQGRISRNRTIAQILFFASLVILIGGFIFTNTVVLNNPLLSFAPCLIMPLILAVVILSVRMGNLYVRLPHPDEAIDDGLNGIDPRSVIFHYVLKPNHVLIAPQGVYTFTTRFQESRYGVTGDKWTDFKSRGIFAGLFLFLRQEALGDPFKDAKRDAELAQVLVDQALPGAGIKVQPVVVFTGPKATVEIENPELPVVFADRKKKPTIRAILRKDRSADVADVAEEEEKQTRRKSRDPRKPKPASKPVKAVKADDTSGPVRLSVEQIKTLDDAFMATISGRALNGIMRTIEEEDED